MVIATQALSACVDQPIESSTTQALVDRNKLAANKLAANKLAANKLAANKLAANKLAANKLALNKGSSDELLSTPDGREVLEYFVSCSIPADIVLVGEFEGVTYEFQGDIGLAPRWLEHSLRADEKGWISACMLARVNKYGVSVPVSLRGSHHELAVTGPEAALYTAQEGAFYGDIFTPGTEPIVWIACRGEAQASGEYGQLNDRDCAEPDPANPGLTMCGFTYAGDCADWQAPQNDYACKQFKALDDGDDDDCGHHFGSLDSEGGYYQKCHDQAGNGHWSGGRQYREVMTVYVTP